MARPESSEHAPDYAKYIAQVPEDDILECDEVRDQRARSLSWPECHREGGGRLSTRLTPGQSSKSSAI